MAEFFKKAFHDMKGSAKAQHEADKANFEAVKAESRADFEENRGHRTFARAKADAKKSRDDARMSPSERVEKMQLAQKHNEMAYPLFYFFSSRCLCYHLLYYAVRYYAGKLA